MTAIEFFTEFGNQKIEFVIFSVCFFMLFFTLFVPMGYYFEFKGRYYVEMWQRARNKRKEEHPEQFISIFTKIKSLINKNRPL